MSSVTPQTLSSIQKHFHAVIMRRAGELVAEHRLDLPVLSFPLKVNDSDGSKAWFAVPGMVGGFAYWFEGDGDNLKLISESWSRVVGGSGQRHEITPEGYALVDEGFV